MIFPKFCEILPFLVLAVAGASGMIYNLGDSTFDDVVDNLPGDALLLVDFYTVGLLVCDGGALCLTPPESSPIALYLVLFFVYSTASMLRAAYHPEVIRFDIARNGVSVCTSSSIHRVQCFSSGYFSGRSGFRMDSFLRHGITDDGSL